jgi:hypothetical protein
MRLIEPNFPQKRGEVELNSWRYGLLPGAAPQPKRRRWAGRFLVSRFWFKAETQGSKSELLVLHNQNILQNRFRKCSFGVKLPCDAEYGESNQAFDKISIPLTSMGRLIPRGQVAGLGRVFWIGGLEML